VKSIDDIRKKRGRGRPVTGIGRTLGLRLYPDIEAGLDAWIRAQPKPRPSKPKAIRTLLRLALDQWRAEQSSGGA
jgi:hypothetical protein